jgi:nucleoid-associated protein Lsr2
MAKTTVTHVTDDIDGSPDARTVSFGFQGVAYWIDLAPKNLERLSKALAPFIENASKSRGSAPSTRRRQGTKTQRGYDLVQLRKWAGKNKINVPSRGRIPAAVIDQYLAAGGR